MRTFWQLASPASATALVGDRACGDLPPNMTYGELAERADALATELPTPGSLGFILAGNDMASVLAYLAALRGRRCVALLPATMPEAYLATLVERYQPEWLLTTATTASLPGYEASPWADRVLHRRAPDASPVHADTALLLTTSGSTGSPKMVRLSYAALDANAASIAEYLALDGEERAITTLPISYSYGLSVLNSHLRAGARTLLTDAAVIARPFWDFFRAESASSLAGVPYTWQMLARLRLPRMELQSLRTLTQAGGALADPLKREIAQMAQDNGWRFFVMYGQTEACARIAYLPPEEVLARPGSIGIAIPGGALSIDADSGELVYRGPNVMMGYAESRAELAAGDSLQGVLRTGDLARVDTDGFHYLTGRLKRIAKVFGNRINLDEVEALLETHFAGTPFAALDAEGSLLVASGGDVEAGAIVERLREALSLHPSGLRVIHAEIPRTPSGKKDYPALKKTLA